MSQPTSEPKPKRKRAPKKGTIEWIRYRQAIGGRKSRKAGPDVRRLGAESCTVWRVVAVVTVDQIWRRVARRSRALGLSFSQLAKRTGYARQYLRRALAATQMTEVLWLKLVEVLGDGDWVTVQLDPIDLEDRIWAAVARSQEKIKTILESEKESTNKVKAATKVRKRKGKK